MLKNYVTTAWRNLVRNKAFSVINIFGLSIIAWFTVSFQSVKAALANPVKSLKSELDGEW